MPQFSDDLFLGAAPTYMGTESAQGFNTLGNPSPMPLGVGPMGRVYIADIVPAASAVNNIALAQTTGTGGNLVLTAGPGVTAINVGGEIRYTFDATRALIVTATSAAFPTTIFGYDRYGQPMRQTFNTIAVSGTTLKAFKSVTRVAIGGPVTAMTVGTTNTFGLPLRVTDNGYILSVKWAGVATQDAGTLVLADQTSPATAFTGDVRGTYTPSSAADGVRRLVMAIAVPAIGSGPQATRVGAIGVTQF